MASTAAVLMPEASVNENDLPARREDQVGVAWKAFAMETESVTERMQQTAHGDLRSRVHGLDAGHDPAAPLKSHGDR